MKQRIVLVTGASRGIGAAIAASFAAAGDYVYLNYHKSAKQAESLQARLRARGFCCEAVCADVSDEAQVKRMVAAIEEKHGALDVLVNNAGIAAQRLFTDITSGDWRRMMGVNIDGAYYCCRCAIAKMISKKSGKIINVSSVWGISGASCEVDYSASKAALIGLTKALAKEAGPSGITVNCVAPGVIRTDMLSGFSEEDLTGLRNRTPLLRLGEAQDVANAVLFLASDQAGFITGQVLSVDGGFGM